MKFLVVTSNHGTTHRRRMEGNAVGSVGMLWPPLCGVMAACNPGIAREVGKADGTATRQRREEVCSECLLEARS